MWYKGLFHKILEKKILAKINIIEHVSPIFRTLSVAYIDKNNKIQRILQTAISQNHMFEI